MTLHKNPANAVAARTAFTLMEMLVVVAILLVLVGAAVPIYLAYKDDAEISRARTDVKMIGDATTSFKLNYGRYPDTLNELVYPPNGGRSYYTEDKLNNPWGQQYSYDPNTTHPQTGEPRVFTFAPSGQEIANW